MEVIYFGDRISGSRIKNLIVDLRRANAPRTVFVDSPGGSFDFFSVLGPALERQGLTTMSGNVRSAAVILYLLGHERLALASSTYFFHEVRTLVHGQTMTIADWEEIEECSREMSGKLREGYQEWLRQMRAAQSWFLSFLAEKTGISTSLFLDLMRNEATLSATEALRYGIVHKIVPQEIVY